MLQTRRCAEAPSSIAAAYGAFFKNHKTVGRESTNGTLLLNRPSCNGIGNSSPVLAAVAQITDPTLAAFCI